MSRNEFCYRVVITSRPKDGAPGDVVPEENLPEWQRKESGGFLRIRFDKWPWRRRFLTRQAAERKLFWQIERGCEGYIQRTKPLEWEPPTEAYVQNPGGAIGWKAVPLDKGTPPPPAQDERCVRGPGFCRDLTCTQPCRTTSGELPIDDAELPGMGPSGDSREYYDDIAAALARTEEQGDNCDGLCITGADLGVPVSGVAYAHPGCPAHAPDTTCQCGDPDRCLSPTHGQVSHAEALAIKNRQGRQS